MKLVEPKVEELVTTFSKRDMWSMIEYAARICYNTTDNMDVNHSEEWVKKTIIPKGHGRALEFGSVYLKIPFWRVYTLLRYAFNPYTKIRHWNCVTTNYRVIAENGWDKHLDWWCKTKWHEVRRYIHWTISRGIADEYRTHTTLSSLMQSTRFCKYSSNRNGGELVFVKPTWYNDVSCLELNDSWVETELHYLRMCSLEGRKAEEARECLPLSIKTEFVQCGFMDAWSHFFDLRAECTENNHPHPDSIFIASKAKKLLGL